MLAKLRAVYATCLAIYRHWDSVRHFVAAGNPDTAVRGLVGKVDSDSFVHTLIPPRGITFDATVSRVIDGDTLEVQTVMTHRVRLLDCWAPETRLGKNTTAADKQRGLAAAAYMQALLARCSNRVRVHLPGNGGDVSRFTHMSRLLGRVWRDMPATMQDETDLSGLMIKAGHATATKED
jgi:endonuclease YncB( thermonuclease family)